MEVTTVSHPRREATMSIETGRRFRPLSSGMSADSGGPYRQ